MLANSVVLNSFDILQNTRSFPKGFYSLLKNIVVFENQCLFLLDLENYNLALYSGQTRHIKEENQPVSLNSLLEKIIIKDRSEVLHQLMKFWDFLKKSEHRISLSHEIMLNYRIKIDSNKIITVMHQSSMLIDEREQRFILNIWTFLEHFDHSLPIRWSITGPGIEDESEMVTVSRPRSLFSDREMQILNLLHQKLNSEEIGEKLFISRNTVDTHRRKILKKAGVGCTQDLIIWALKNKLISG